MKIMTINGDFTLSPCNKNDIPAGTILPKKMTMRFPGDVHSTLLRNKCIPDPYYRKNELDVQWVGKTDWQAETSFSVSANFLKGRQFIELEDADTFVRVFVNKKEAGLCQNFFRKWRFEITDLLKAGTNTLRLVFESAERHACEKAETLTHPAPCSVYDIYSPHRNLVRKTQCNAGWDWGICLMVCGVYSPIKIVQTATGFLDYVQTTTVPTGKEKNWEVGIKAIYTSLKATKTRFSFAVSEDSEVATSPKNPKAADGGHENVTASADGNSVLCEKSVDVQLIPGENIIETTLTIKNPDIWWPAGCSPADEKNITKTGEPLFRENTLYTLTAKAAGSIKKQNLAFRTLEAVSEKDEHGRSLYFKVNGKPVYAKGSNWIPCDALPERQTPQKYNELLSALVAANQNCIRVWGGGRYEKDVFYDLCDRKGILIWHDCMFACSTYPADADFLDNVRLEVRHQIRRLSHHPSIALWCGNNENLGAITWYEESRKNRDLYVVDYDRLNEGTVGDEVRKNDPSRRWWSSSPCSGNDDFADNWHSDGCGDMHYWSVWHEKKPFEAYYDITPRFVSEFGYQSLPSLSETKTFADEKTDFNITSPVFEFHQRSPGGNSIIFENFARYFRVPSTFADMLYLSQVQQALAIKTAVNYWRSLRPVCMGAIIWQLNDLWPVSSWSSIEYSGKWKLLHYAAKQFFEPIGLSLYKKDGKIKCFVVNDTSLSVIPALRISYIDFNGNLLHQEEITDKEVPGNCSTCFFNTDVNSTGFPEDSFFVYAELTYGDTTTSDALFCTQPKKCELMEPKIKYSVHENKDGSYKITLKAEKPAFYVLLDANSISGVFSRNLLTIIPGKPETVTFRTNKNGRKLSEKAFQKKLVVTTLRDIY
ncbi:MAG: glycoside hydrolase family 2 protein [Treponemataceae bacterium]|nr:glycoside hydrolase family 2 protein [Treponemataceae bacterium]